jgi:leucyl-tRNA synthetase
LWALVYRHHQISVAADTDFSNADDETKGLRCQLHKILQRINRDINRYQYNTVVASCMELVNILDRFDPSASPDRKAAMREALEVLIRVLAPITPHLCHALWQALAMEEELLDACWPVVDPLALNSGQVQMVVQVNGKLRGAIEVGTNVGDAEIRVCALADPRVVRHVGDAVVRKVIIVPGRLVNIVV